MIKFRNLFRDHCINILEKGIDPSRVAVCTECFSFSDTL